VHGERRVTPTFQLLRQPEGFEGLLLGSVLIHAHDSPLMYPDRVGLADLDARIMSNHRSDLLALVNGRLDNSGEPNPALCAPEVLGWLEENRPDLLREAALLGLEDLNYYSAEAELKGRA
jgi:hypothetical protein